MASHSPRRESASLPFALSALACPGLTGCTAQRSARVPIHRWLAVHGQENRPILEGELDDEVTRRKYVGKLGELTPDNLLPHQAIRQGPKVVVAGALSWRLGHGVMLAGPGGDVDAPSAPVRPDGGRRVRGLASVGLRPGTGGTRYRGGGGVDHPQVEATRDEVARVLPVAVEHQPDGRGGHELVNTGREGHAPGHVARGPDGVKVAASSGTSSRVTVVPLAATRLAKWESYVEGARNV